MRQPFIDILFINSETCNAGARRFSPLYEVAGAPNKLFILGGGGGGGGGRGAYTPEMLIFVFF